MRFWDSSAIVALLVEQAASEIMNSLLREDDAIVVWWGTWAECAVSISRLKREGSFDDESEQETRMSLDGLAETWSEIDPTNDMRLLAAILSKHHPLKAADSLQLAAALRWCEGEVDGASFVCLDRTLRRAAADEGFGVSPEVSNN